MNTYNLSDLNPNLTDINPASAEDLNVVVSEISHFMGQNGIACRFLREKYSLEVYDIHNALDMRVAMEAHGYADTCLWIARICSQYNTPNLERKGRGFTEFTDDDAEDALWEFARTDWRKFAHKLNQFATNLDLPELVEALAVEWTAEAIAEYEYAE